MSDSAENRLFQHNRPIADFYRARLLPRAQAHCTEILEAAELLALLPENPT
ncbi:hypothetical protein [Roseococcus sp.]|uniref:hypothetical protein n=1 Tax=Roseococcus sp. TaxID=2109646 RepID=UPI003BA923CC